MRQIKYRVWDERNEKMHDNIQLIDSHDDNGWIVIVNLREKDWDKKIATNVYFRKQIKIMQFIGMHDRNGKEIYEGDIVTYKNHPFQYIRWNREFLLFGMSFQTGATTDIPTGCEVIGNIYENPNLFEQCLPQAIGTTESPSETAAEKTFKGANQ